MKHTTRIARNWFVLVVLTALAGVACTHVARGQRDALKWKTLCQDVVLEKKEDLIKRQREQLRRANSMLAMTYKKADRPFVTVE